MGAKDPIVYIFRGQVERGARYRWADGYSAASASGGVLYPWMTKRECYADARAQGRKATFKRNEG